MQRQHLLAAELFRYNFDIYREHLGEGNNRFDTYMPADATLLERAESEGWDDARVARELEVEPESVADWRERYRRARAIVDAADPAAAFRLGVRFSIEDALARGLAGPADVERLVTRICSRASDLSVLLELRGETLERYSAALRQED